MNGRGDKSAGPMRVLVAVDGSDASRLTVDLVANLAWPAATQIQVIEAVETGAALFGGPWPTLAVARTDEIDEEFRTDANRNIVAAREQLARAGLSVSSVVIQGRPATAVVDTARRMPADLIVVGSRGHGTIESMLLGSVSAEVVDHASAPVLVARGRQFRRVVLAWDGSESAANAANVVAAWPVFAGTDVSVVSVADIGMPFWAGFPEAGSPELMPMLMEGANASRARHDELAGEMAARLRAAGVAAEPLRRDGDAATEVLAAATESKADLIVMGTHGRTGLTRLLLGSVTRNVVRHAPCSVLVVRPTPPQPADG